MMTHRQPMAMTWGGMVWHANFEGALACGLVPKCIPEGCGPWWQEAQYHEIARAPISKVCKRCEKVCA